ncbi:hypothetical protein EDB92DRAFT_2110559 [Lactarius akahatsu]|uniref:Uncharacterized protein n=1 Tax=Lactarius akahatsu TaxID=416441 RepID=A0AAD4QDB7_9AGAM|nr:hypothetical protein EDB92DRAFT_2110559 [Lactarius akahatsu]
MVDWHDSATVAAEEHALVKLVHVIGGIYIWEIVSRLGFEYSVISKKRKFTWSFLLYLGCRWCPLFAVALQFLGFDVSHEIDCHACAVLSFMSAYLSFMCTSALIILRVAVLWNRSKIIIAFTCAVWIGNTATYAYSLTTLRSAWTGKHCSILHTDHSRISVLSTFTTDLILLVLMLAGLRRWKNAPKSCGVWRLLRTQGLIWVMVVTLAELPPTVFIFLNLNDPMNLIFQHFALIIVPLSAARLYRGLIDYPSNGLVTVVNEPLGEHSTPFSHQTYRTKQKHDSEGGSVVLDILPVKTSGSEVPKGETSEGGNVV